MSTQEIFYQVALAGVLGIAGQLLRVIAGLTKLGQEAGARGVDFWQLFVPAKLVVSILVGFVAGILAWVVADKAMAVDFLKGDAETVKKAVLAIIAAGYAGTDFIEGIMGKLLSKSPAASRNNDQPANQ